MGSQDRGTVTVTVGKGRKDWHAYVARLAQQVPDRRVLKDASMVEETNGPADP